MSATPQSALALDVSSTFHFESLPVRVVMRNGEPWFLAADLCAVLRINATAIRKLDDDEKGLHSMQTPGGLQQLSIVSESGLYTLALRCRNAMKVSTTPYRFRRWVTAEVLPAIRKTGRYEQTTTPTLAGRRFLLTIDENGHEHVEALSDDTLVFSGGDLDALHSSLVQMLTESAARTADDFLDAAARLDMSSARLIRTAAR